MLRAAKLHALLLTSARSIEDPAPSVQAPNVEDLGPREDNAESDEGNVAGLCLALITTVLSCG